MAVAHNVSVAGDPAERLRQVMIERGHVLHRELATEVSLAWDSGHPILVRGGDRADLVRDFGGRIIYPQLAHIFLYLNARVHYL